MIILTEPSQTSMIIFRVSFLFVKEVLPGWRGVGHALTRDGLLQVVMVSVPEMNVKRRDRSDATHVALSPGRLFEYENVCSKL